LIKEKSKKGEALFLQELKNEMQKRKIPKTVPSYYFMVPLSPGNRAHPVGEVHTLEHSFHPKITRKNSLN